MRFIFTIILLLALSFVGKVASADSIDDISELIFEPKSDRVKIKNNFRKCSGDSECVAVLSLCRWRAVSRVFEKQVSDISKRVKLECKWPPPPVNPPTVKCISRMCEVPPDGRNY